MIEGTLNTIGIGIKPLQPLHHSHLRLLILLPLLKHLLILLPQPLLIGYALRGATHFTRTDRALPLLYHHLCRSHRVHLQPLILKRVILNILPIRNNIPRLCRLDRQISSLASPTDPLQRYHLRSLGPRRSPMQFGGWALDGALGYLGNQIGILRVESAHRRPITPVGLPDTSVIKVWGNHLLSIRLQIVVLADVHVLGWGALIGWFLLNIIWLRNCVPENWSDHLLPQTATINTHGTIRTCPCRSIGHFQLKFAMILIHFLFLKF